MVMSLFQTTTIPEFSSVFQGSKRTRFSSIAMSNSHLFLGTNTSSIYMFDIIDCSYIGFGSHSLLRGSVSLISPLHMSTESNPDVHYLAVASSEDSLHIFSVSEGNFRHLSHNKCHSPISSLSWSFDGSLLFYGEGNNVVVSKFRNGHLNQSTTITLGQTPIQMDYHSRSNTLLVVTQSIKKDQKRSSSDPSLINDVMLITIDFERDTVSTSVKPVSFKVKGDSGLVTHNSGGLLTSEDSELLRAFVSKSSLLYIVNERGKSKSMGLRKAVPFQCVEDQKSINQRQSDDVISSILIGKLSIFHSRYIVSQSVNGFLIFDPLCDSFLISFLHCSILDLTTHPKSDNLFLLHSDGRTVSLVKEIVGEDKVQLLMKEERYGELCSFIIDEQFDDVDLIDKLIDSGVGDDVTRRLIDYKSELELMKKEKKLCESFDFDCFVPNFDPSAEAQNDLIRSNSPSPTREDDVSSEAVITAEVVKKVVPRRKSRRRVAITPADRNHSIDWRLSIKNDLYNSDDGSTNMSSVSDVEDDKKELIGENLVFLQTEEERLECIDFLEDLDFDCFELSETSSVSLIDQLNSINQNLIDHTFSSKERQDFVLLWFKFISVIESQSNYDLLSLILSPFAEGTVDYSSIKFSDLVQSVPVIFDLVNSFLLNFDLCFCSDCIAGTKCSLSTEESFTCTITKLFELENSFKFLNVLGIFDLVSRHHYEKAFKFLISFNYSQFTHSNPIFSEFFNSSGNSLIFNHPFFKCLNALKTQSVIGLSFIKHFHILTGLSFWQLSMIVMNFEDLCLELLDLPDSDFFGILSNLEFMKNHWSKFLSNLPSKPSQSVKLTLFDQPFIINSKLDSVLNQEIITFVTVVCRKCPELLESCLYGLSSKGYFSEIMHLFCSKVVEVNFLGDFEYIALMMMFVFEKFPQVYDYFPFFNSAYSNSIDIIKSVLILTDRFELNQKNIVDCLCNLFPVDHVYNVAKNSNIDQLHSYFMPLLKQNILNSAASLTNSEGNSNIILAPNTLNLCNHFGFQVSTSALCSICNSELGCTEVIMGHFCGHLHHESCSSTSHCLICFSG
ncbi:hypothetical protein P9112_004771 [Eukaryota sp. TZLM1-RC]